MDSYLDDDFGGALLRGYAHSTARGYLSAINITPTSARNSDILNLDVVLTEFPKFLAGKFSFSYGDRRIAHRSGLSFGKFEHIHLSVDDEQREYLFSQIGKKITLAGDEIAIQKNGESWFWVDPNALQWLGLPPDHNLSVEARGILKRATNESQCHSIFLRSLNKQAAGSGMGGHFAAGAAGVSGFGGQIARNSLDKAKKHMDEKLKELHDRQSGGKARNNRGDEK
jgi:hypothetical protein